jgi:hypothetical protein
MSAGETNSVASWTSGRLLPILALLKRLAQVPNLADAAAVREWVRRLVALGASCTAFLPEVAKRALELLTQLTASDAVWDALYALILYFFSSEHVATASGEVVVVLGEEPEVERRLGQLAGAMAVEASRSTGEGAAVAAFDPTRILQIVAAIVALLKELRKP